VVALGAAAGGPSRAWKAHVRRGSDGVSEASMIVTVPTEIGRQQIEIRGNSAGNADEKVHSGTLPRHNEAA
jgi:hypothetical protein